MAGKTKIKSDDSKTKIKDDKGKIKDADGKMKVKNNDDMNSDNDKTKIKGDKAKIKDAEGKVKIKGEGNMNTSSGTMNNGMGTMNTSTNVNVVTIGGWTTNPPTLPVVGTGVSAEVVTMLKNKYGATLYDIKQIKSTSGQMIYVVRVMDNGGMRSEYVGADGTVVSQ
jgi:hypothetical protein